METRRDSYAALPARELPRPYRPAAGCALSIKSNQDFDDMIQALTASGVEFVIVGAYAMAAHGSPRATADIDIFVRPTKRNAAHVIEALERFGAPIEAHAITSTDFARPGSVYQIGLPPRRIDILTSISGVTFSEAIRNAISGPFGGQLVRFIGKRALIRNKRATGRTKDMADVEVLEQSAPPRRH